MLLLRYDYRQLLGTRFFFFFWSDKNKLILLWEESIKLLKMSSGLYIFVSAHNNRITSYYQSINILKFSFVLECFLFFFHLEYIYNKIFKIDFIVLHKIYESIIKLNQWQYLSILFIFFINFFLQTVDDPVSVFSIAGIVRECISPKAGKLCLYDS